VSDNDRIECRICGAKVHAIQTHLKEQHAEMTLAQYQAQFPGAPIFSEAAKRVIAAKKAPAPAAGEGAVAAPACAPAAPITVAALAAATVTPIRKSVGSSKKTLADVFALGDVPGVRNARGEHAQLSVLDADPDFSDLVPAADPNHVWDIELLKMMVMAIELGIPAYAWGHAGTGKTTDWLNVCARTNRPAIRVQHTLNMEESHVIGQRIARDGSTPFQLGPLPLAMRYGWVYIADEYDRAMPGVLSVYQPVLEGQPLVIKEADPADRVIKPHKNFRIVGTGNSNGSGDETGLYQSTVIQDASNYDRWGIVLQKNYMARDLEEKIIAGQAGIGLADAKKLVEFATAVRESYAGGKISNTISPRTLINAAKIGVMRGNLRIGIAFSFGNKLNKVDRQVVDSVAQRFFGGDK
jgi:cobaltochelatase CobS